MQREIPLYTLQGVKDAEVTVHQVYTEDGLGLTLHRFRRGESGDAVMIAHGLTTSMDMFIMPEHYNLVSYLLDHGYGDVWCLDYRMSNRHPYNMTRHDWTMDDVALYDFPAALDVMRQHVGGSRIHVIAHCLGSVSFMMSLFGKQVEGLTSAIVNSVALTPRIRTWSRIKLTTAPFFVEYVLQMPYLSPRWPREKGFTLAKLVSKLVSAHHRECDVPECHMLSMMWGTGFPALYHHDNLHDVTHRRGGDLYGPTSMNYYRHVAKMVNAGSKPIKYNPKNKSHDRLPNNYFEYASEIETPCLLITGEKNHIFTDSNVVCHQELEKRAPGRHALHVFPGYGHQDVFMGKNNHEDIFPRLVQWLDEKREASMKREGREEAVGI